MVALGLSDKQIGLIFGAWMIVVGILFFVMSAIQ